MSQRAYLPRLLRLSGIDRAIAYTVLGRAWVILAGPVTLTILAAFLSPEEQGFYYTFSSILGLQVFFELGLSYVLLQFASHEKARLEWTAQGTLTGDPTAEARLASLLRRGLLWYGVVAILAILLLLPAGLLFFASHEPATVQVAWQIPWLWVVLVSACTLFISPIFAVLEGCGLVAEVALVRMAQGIVANLLFWLVLWQHWGLLAAPIPNTVGVLCGIGWLITRKRALLRSLLARRLGAAVVVWWQEVWPFQWKIALTWISGYFVFQLFNPVLFAFQGPIAAGQMGMSLSITTAISTLALAWVNTKAPAFGNLVAKRDFATLDKVFFQCLRQSFMVAAVAGAAFWLGALYLFQIHHPFSQRLLAPFPLGLLTAAVLVNHIMFSEAIYLRAHKQEPFIWLSVTFGILVGASTYILGKFYGATGMVIGYFLILLILDLGGGTWIFIQKRREWHSAILPLEPQGEVEKGKVEYAQSESAS